MNEKLLKKAKAGDIEARNQLIERNIRFVHYINKRFGGTQDGFQEAIFGFVKAIEKYDNKKGPFLNYVAIWIRQTVSRNRMRYKYGAACGLIEKYKKLKSLDIKISDDEKMKKLKVDKETYNTLIKMELAWNLGDYEKVTAKSDGSIEIRIDLEQLIEKELDTLEKSIIKARFYEGKTLRKIGKELGYSAEYIRLREKKALEKLKKKL